MNIIYAKGSEGIQFNKICEEGTRKASAKGWINTVSPLNGRMVRLEHIKKPVDIYHCHSAHSLQGLRKAKELGAVTILQRDSCHINDMLAWCEAGNNLWKDKYPQHCSDLRARTNLDFQLAEYEEADYILVASKLEQKSFIKYGFKDKIKRIPFAVDFDKFKPVIGVQWTKPIRVVLGGNPCIRKGYPEANEACKKVGLKLNVVPGQPRGNEFMISQLQKYDICLAPTREDGYPQQVMESMSCGLIPIVSNRNGVCELINKGVNGYVVDMKQSTKHIIDEIAYILDALNNAPTEIRVDISIEARESVMKRTWEDYGNDVFRFYKKIGGK